MSEHLSTLFYTKKDNLGKFGIFGLDFGRCGWQNGDVMEKSLSLIVTVSLLILAGSAVWCAWELHRAADVLENCSGRGRINVNSF